MHQTDHIGPAFELLRAAQARCCPKELLFVEAIAMFLPKAAGIQARDFSQRRKRAAEPPEPTRPWVALGAPRAHTDDPNDGDGHLTHLREMQVAPNRHLYGLPWASLPLQSPSGVWWVLGSVPLKRGPSNGERPT